MLTAILANAFSLYVQWRRGKADARYLALRVAVILEAFGLSCYRVLMDHDSHDLSDGKFGKLHESFPEIAPYPEDAAWQSLDTDLLSRTLNFRNELMFTQRRIELQERVGLSGVPDIMCEECAHRGSQAMDLVDDLRLKYRLLPLQRSYDFAKTLRHKHQEFTILQEGRSH